MRDNALNPVDLSCRTCVLLRLCLFACLLIPRGYAQELDCPPSMPLSVDASGLGTTRLDALGAESEVPEWAVADVVVAALPASAKHLTLHPNAQLKPWLVLRLEHFSGEQFDQLVLVAASSVSDAESAPTRINVLASGVGTVRVGLGSRGGPGAGAGSSRLLAFNLDGSPGDELLVGESGYEEDSRHGAIPMSGAVLVLYPATWLTAAQVETSVWGEEPALAIQSAESLIPVRRLLGAAEESLGTGIVALEGLLGTPGLALLSYAAGDSDEGLIRLLRVGVEHNPCQLLSPPCASGGCLAECKLDSEVDQRVISGENAGLPAFSQLGYRGALLKEAQGQPVGLAVSAIGSAVGASPTSGVVYVFGQKALQASWESPEPYLLPTAALALTGARDEERFGTALLSVPLGQGGQRLYVGAAPQASTGAVYAWELSGLAMCDSSGGLSAADPCGTAVYVSMQTGRDIHDGLGSVLASSGSWEASLSSWEDRACSKRWQADSAPELWVGEPEASSYPGRVLLVSSHAWSRSVDEGEPLDAMLELSSSSREQLGAGILEADLNGNGVAEVIVRATGSSEEPRAAGSVIILWDPATQLSDRDGDGVVASPVDSVPLAGVSLSGGDCNDLDATKTGADRDGDAAMDCLDCDDTDPSRYPGAYVQPGADPTDANCDGNSAVSFGFQDEHVPEPDAGGCLSWTTYSANPGGAENRPASEQEGLSWGQGLLVFIGWLRCWRVCSVHCSRMLRPRCSIDFGSQNHRGILSGSTHKNRLLLLPFR